MAVEASTLLASFLEGLPSEGGIKRISPDRAYAHAEEDYDRQYDFEADEAISAEREAGALVDFLLHHGFPQGGSLLEIGCGTGRVFTRLARRGELGHLLITDPSPAFCRIVQRKLKGVTPLGGRVDLAVMLAEDAALLPPGSVSAILLRSVLHHIADVEGFLAGCAAILPPGGILVCEEPYYEGYLMMGFAGQFIEGALRFRGYECSTDERQLVAHFVSTMQFYCRRDLDKSQDEDKHLFRPDELMAAGDKLGLKLSHFPNWRITSSEQENRSAWPGYFHRFFRDYVRFCMDWPTEFAVRAAEAMAPYFRFFEPLESGGHSAPQCFGTFVFKKRA